MIHDGEFQYLVSMKFRNFVRLEILCACVTVLDRELFDVRYAMYNVRPHEVRYICRR
jgi:hypothetical protein